MQRADALTAGLTMKPDAPTLLEFVERFCLIRDDAGQWIPFRLWPAQKPLLAELPSQKQAVRLKARQLGLTWLVLAYALYSLIYRPGSTVLLFSRRDTEAQDLLERLKEMHRHLPVSVQQTVTGDDNKHRWELANGSKCLAFPCTVGDSYTATLAVIDEADLVPDLDKLLRSVKPTVDAGGQLVLLSKSNKSEPNSAFKRIYRAARSGENSYHHAFLPWQARPDRTQAWYDR